MSQECVKQGICRRCGSSTVVTSAPHNYSGIWCSRTATCVKCRANEEYVYELVFVGYEKPGEEEGIPDIIPVSDEKDALERLAEFQLEKTPEGCPEGVPFLSRAMLYPLVGEADAERILKLWTRVEVEE